MSRVYLKAKVLAGTSIEEAIKDAKKIAERTGTGIEFRFNGVLMAITASSDIQKKIEDYEFEIKRMRNMEVTENE